VRQNAAAVEETMVRLGANPVATADHRPLRAWVDLSTIAARGVRVRQDLRRHTNTLLGYSGDGSVSVLPQPTLRGALHVALQGIDRPLTVCAPPEELDLSPCVPTSAVALDNPLVHLERDGTLRFAEQLTAHEAVSLAASARRLVVPLSVGGRTLTELAWDLVFETPADLVLESHSRGGDGPDLQVHLERMSTGRLGYSVVNGDDRYEAVVETSRASSFHVTSKGADGANGFDGSSGHDGGAGLMGSGASCPSFAGSDGRRGEDGGAGADGHAGSPGGRGGNIVVEVAHNDTSSQESLTLLRGSIRSEGGSGGAGGSGGLGGRGGSGGSARLGE